MDICVYLYYTSWKNIPEMNPEEIVQYFFEQYKFVYKNALIILYSWYITTD